MDIKRAVGSVSGGKEMAIAQSTPAKTKKMTVASVLKQIETEKVRWIDLQFVDVLGALQHITIPATSLGNEEFKRVIETGRLVDQQVQGDPPLGQSHEPGPGDLRGPPLVRRRAPDCPLHRRRPRGRESRAVH